MYIYKSLQRIYINKHCIFIHITLTQKGIKELKCSKGIDQFATGFFDRISCSFDQTQMLLSFLD